MKIIIFAGGFGTRMWPVSRKSNPKQFSKIVRGRSFFERTVSRFHKGFKWEDIFVSTEKRYVHFIKEQAPNSPRENIIIEPERRDLLGAVGLVSAIIEKRFPGEVMFFSWADHFVADADKFIKAVKAAGEYTLRTGKPTSINERPVFASTYNGWVKMGKKIDKVDGFPIYEIDRFTEKPDKKKAARYLKSGDYLIHTGYGAWKSDDMLSYYRKYAPAVYQGLLKIMDSYGTKKYEKVLIREYHKFEKQSVEFAVYQKLPKSLRVTIPVETGWEDAGTWGLFYDAMVEKKEENVVEGNIKTEFVDAKKNLVIGNGKKIVSVVGLEGVAVIDAGDAILVCDLKKSGEVKDLFKKLEKEKSRFVK